MKAINVTGQAPTKRQKLQDILPLDTPLVVQIFPIYACNLKCNYCIFQKPKEERHFISDVTTMNYEHFKACVIDMTKFKSKIKTLRFVGIGEPLLHPRIDDMIRFAKKKDIAEKVEIITNGTLINRNVAKILVDSGLDRIVISLNGLSNIEYKNNCQAEIDFYKMVDNLKYLYSIKENLEIYIKIVDSFIKGKSDENFFYDMFGNICNYIGVESTVPIHSGINLPNRQKTQFGQNLQDIKVCPQPFYHMQINPDFKVVPCQSFEYPEILGDASQDSVVDIWNGNSFNVFRNYHINNIVCNNCKMKKYRIHESDILDPEKLNRGYYE